MKVTFLLTWADGMGGTEHAGLTQAAHLSEKMTVEVISVFRTGDAAFFDATASLGMRYLVDARASVQRPVRASDLTDAECLTLSEQGSELINRQWEGSFNRLSDLEMQYALSALDTDVLVTTTPALTAGALQLVPSRVVVVQQEHRASAYRAATGGPLLPFAPRLDALVALTDRTREWLAESLGEAAPRLETIPNVVPQGFRPRSSATNPVVVMAGRLAKDKRFEDAIEAFHQVADEHPEWTMRLFGDGPQRNRLKRLVDSLGRHDRIFLPGSSASMSDEWAQAGLTLVPSKGEALSLVLLEAYAAGVPAIAYDTPTGPPEVIRHGVDGLLVPDGDVELLGEAMDRLMGDDHERTAFGEAACRRSKDFSAERIMPRWESLFSDLVAERDDPQLLGRRLDRAGRRVALAGARFHPAAPADGATGWREDQRELEKQIAAAHPALITSGGRLAAVDDTLLHPDAVTANLLLVADAMESAGVGFVVLAGRTTHSRIAVAAEDRRAAFEALSQATAGEPVYAELLLPRLERPGTVLAGSVPATIDVQGLRVFRPVVTTSRTLRYGPGVACDLESWPYDAESQVRLAPLGSTTWGSSLPSLTPDAVVEVAGRSLPTRRELVVRDTVVIDEPIDAVWTWVDGSDPLWRDRRDSARRSLGIPVSEANDDDDVRFRDRDELRYSMRSVAMYAPWIRRHYLVTDDQVPDWLDSEHPGITVVSHRDIFTDQTVLPNFNSHSIGSQLHHIQGLAEQFLVMNDDVFLARPLPPGQFFDANGMAKSFISSAAIDLGPVVEGDGDHLAGRKNARDLVHAVFDRSPTHGYLHAPHAVLRSFLFELEERFPAEFARTAAAQFRSSTDVAVLSGLHHEFGWMSRRVTRSSLRVAYVNTSKHEQHANLIRLLAQRDRDVFCLNDVDDGDVTAAEQALVIRAFLEAYFPVPGPFERRGRP